MTNFDKKLDKLMEARKDATFLKRLSKWLFELSGNVNAAQRLNAIALRTKQLEFED